MHRKVSQLVLPAALLVFGCVPAAAQIRIGVDLPSIHIHIAPDAPPPPRVEMRLVRPSRNHIWIEGYWDRQGDRWAWTPGRWEEPVRRGVVWVRPQYIREGGVYRYEPAHWSHQRMEEGEDYSRWHREHGRDRDDRRGRDDRDGHHDHGRGHGRGRGHDKD